MSIKKRSKPTKLVKNVDLSLAREELEFLRDLFGLSTPVKEAGETIEGNVCQMLAGASHRASVEENLWNKIVNACEKTGVTIGDSAPSYAVSAHDVPTMYIYKLQE
jgi:hypothetical protein